MIVMVLAAGSALWPSTAAADCGEPVENRFMVGEVLPANVPTIPWWSSGIIESLDGLLTAERTGDGVVWESIPFLLEEGGSFYVLIRLADLIEGDRVRLHSAIPSPGTASAEFVVGPPVPQWSPTISLTKHRGVEWFGDGAYGNDVDGVWANITVDSEVLEDYGDLPFVGLVFSGDFYAERDICSEAEPGASVYGRYTQRLFLNCNRMGSPRYAAGDVRMVVSFAGTDLTWESKPLELELACDPPYAQPNDDDAGGPDIGSSIDVAEQAQEPGAGCSSAARGSLPPWAVLIAVLWFQRGRANRRAVA